MRETIIKPSYSMNNVWRELWDYRELFYILAWRDLLVRYKQTVIGIIWAVLRPLLTMSVFVVVFSKIAGLTSGNVPYPILVFAGMLPWQFASSTLSEAANSLIVEANMISKVYFPRIIIPTTAMVVNMVDFLISCIILMILMYVYGFYPNWKLFTLPVFLLLAVLPSLGIGYWLAALNVKYRDFRYIVPFIVQFGLYISPVGFSSDVIGDKWRLFYSLNPMVGVIDGFRWALLGSDVELYLPGLLLSIVIAVLSFWGGVWYFFRTEREFADII
jgi:lipopolysaccharide transport system permease protein